MADQIVLAWTVDVTNTSFGPAQAAAALAAVPLYTDATTDPVLGQNFGLTVASDVTTTPSASTAKRTLTLNMTAAHTPTAPPPFPCHPRTTTPPVLPYPLRKAVSLPGSFFVALGATSIPTTLTQLSSLSNGDSIQFLSQVGVFYTYVAAGSTATAINITPAYSGPPGNVGAFKEIDAPVTLAAIYSSSDLDTAGVATVPAIPAGPGARTVAITYTDSTGATGRAATATLTGRRPAAISFTNGNGEISAIENISIATSGAFGNSIGELTLVELSDSLPALRADTTPGTGVGAGQGDNTFLAFTDAAQMLIVQALVYLPPSYFALAAQQESAPMLAGDFLVTTGSADVPTTEDQSGALSAGNTLRFASQMEKIYTVSAVTPKIVKLTEVYSGLDYNFTDPDDAGTNTNAGTQGNLGTKVINKLTGAMTPVTAGAPSNDQLAGPLAQFVNPGNAAPPPIPHTVDPATMTPALVSADYLSGVFTRTLQLALAGVPITSEPITLM